KSQPRCPEGHFIGDQVDRSQWWNERIGSNGCCATIARRRHAINAPDRLSLPGACRLDLKGTICPQRLTERFAAPQAGFWHFGDIETVRSNVRLRTLSGHQHVAGGALSGKPEWSSLETIPAYPGNVGQEYLCSSQIDNVDLLAAATADLSIGGPIGDLFGGGAARDARDRHKEQDGPENQLPFTVVGRFSPEMRKNDPGVEAAAPLPSVTAYND